MSPNEGIQGERPGPLAYTASNSVADIAEVRDGFQETDLIIGHQNQPAVVV